MGTKNNPGAYDCHANAEPDEPLFVLLARDPSAPEMVERWAAARVRLIEKGIKPESDRAVVLEAMACAEDMRRWRKANRS